MADQNYNLGIKAVADVGGFDQMSERVTRLQKQIAAPMNGPAVKPRFDAEEQKIRDVQAGIIQGMRLKAQAHAETMKQIAVEAEARKRLFGVQSAPTAPKKDAWLESMKKSDEASRLRLLNFIGGQKMGGGTGTGSGNGGRGGSGAGGKGGKDGPLGGIFKSKDDFDLGGGNKLVGGLAKAAGTAVLVAKGMELAGTGLKEYRDKLAEGVSSGDAFNIALLGAAKQLPLIGEFTTGLSAIYDEFSGDADIARKEIQKAKDDADRKRTNAIIKGEQDRARSLLGGLDDKLEGESGAARVRQATLGDPTGFSGAREQANMEHNAALRELQRRADELARKQHEDGNDISSDHFAEANEKIQALKDQAAQKWADAMAEIAEKEKAANAEQLAKRTEANLNANKLLVDGFKQQADLSGDVASAQQSIALTMADEADARREQLKGLIATNLLDDEHRKLVERQLGELGPLTQKRIEKMQADLVKDAAGKDLGTATTIEGFKADELRRQAARTGDTSKLLQADQADTFKAFQDKLLKLQEISATATGQNKLDANAMIQSLPQQLADALKQSGATITAADLANATNARANDVGGLTGLSMAAREDALTSGKSDAAKTADFAGKLYGLMQKLVQNQIDAATALQTVFGS